MAAELPAGGTAGAVPTAVTGVTINGLRLSDKSGEFMDGDGYLAATRFPGGIRFSGKTGAVEFW